MGAPRHTKRGAQEALLAIRKFGSGVGLHRMLALCGPLAEGGWMRQLDAIKVTGSNGKGSVSVMVASVLKELGISAGLYTSPHLLEFNERIVVDGRPISDSELAEAVEWFEGRREEYERRFPGDNVGAFEAFTAIALRHFSARQPRALVAEAGIGGRYDSTRIIPGRVVGLTSLDLEHTALLGDSLEMIAYDKADLCPHGGVIVTGVSEPEILRRLRAYCALRGITLRCAAERAAVRRVSFDETHMELDLELDGDALSGLRVALRGVHQATNVAVAILLLREWLGVHEPSLPAERFEEAVRRGMLSLRWPGRFERVHAKPEVFVDVGHSPGAIESLVETVRTALPGRRILLVTGVSYDKEVEAIVKGLLAVADAVICTRAYHKGAPPEEILRIVRDARPEVPAFVGATIEEAVRRALEYASAKDMTILVAGGLFLSVEATQALRGGAPKDLRFF